MSNLFLETTPAGGGASSIIMLVVLVGLMALMFFMSSRSNKKRQKKAQELRDSLRVGNRIKTIGGIYGVVTEVADDFLIIETVENCFLKIDKHAIYQSDEIAQPPVVEDSNQVEETAFEESNEDTKI